LHAACRQTGGTLEHLDVVSAFIQIADQNKMVSLGRVTRPWRYASA
jgi:hypothetical protein